MYCDFCFYLRVLGPKSRSLERELECSRSLEVVVQTLKLTQLTQSKVGITSRVLYDIRSSRILILKTLM